MAFQFVKGWPEGSLELQLPPDALGAVTIGSIATVGNNIWVVAGYAADGSNAALQPAFIFDHDPIRNRLLGALGQLMITVDAAHYATDTYAVGDSLTAIAGKFAKPTGANEPVIAKVLAIETATGKMTLLWYGPNHR